MMDPAETEQIHGALSKQGVLLGSHETQLQRLTDAVNQIGDTLQQLQALLPREHVVASTPDPPPLAVPTSREPKIPAPQRYDGKPGTCKGFLTQVSLIFELQPSTFASEKAKIAYIISLLCDRALDWASALWRQQSPICLDLKVFTDTLQQVFDHPVSGREAARRLLDLCQGNQAVADYAIDFRTLASESRWDSEALVSTFYRGLSEDVKDELASRDWGSSLEELITLAIRIDNRVRERRRERRTPQVMPMQAPPNIPEMAHLNQQTEDEPMQLGGTRLSPKERERRRREGRCFYCGGSDHMRTSCPELALKAKAH